MLATLHATVHRHTDEQLVAKTHSLEETNQIAEKTRYSRLKYPTSVKFNSPA